MAVDPFDAIILAGGGARRLGGIDKAALVVRGRTLLDTVIDACTGAARVVVVGPRRRIAHPRTVRWVQESPPGGGPVAAIAAGLRVASAPTVVVLACDLPYLAAPAIGDLLACISAWPERDGAIFVDAAGHDQPLVGAYRRAPLARALDGLAPPLAGVALRTLLNGLRLERLADESGVTRDCDTWYEVEVARRDR